ncbi:hypothetical protein BH09VER1_BH09VER1_07490 [soil metagenome]
MKLQNLISCALAANAMLGIAPASEQIPAGGTSIIAKDIFVTPSIKFIGKEYAELKMVPVTGMPFKTALQMNVKTQPIKEYAVQLKAGLTLAVKKGDTLLASFYARTLKGDNDTSDGQVTFAIKGDISQALITRHTTNPGAEWQQYFVPIDAKDSADLSEGVVTFSFGSMIQTLEIGGIEVLNYEGNVALNTLPKTEITYAGRELNAAWRKDATKRIEEIRKADITVVVKDAEGKIVPNATVDVNMTKHAFNWGAAVTSRAFEHSAAAKPILENHQKLFNQGVPITYFVWNLQETPEGKSGANKILKYFRDHDMTTRAHVLVWERMDHFPPDVQEMVKNKEADKLRARITKYVKDTVGEYKGRVDEWVVENEAVDNSQIRDILGEASIAEWFKAAREADPSARLMINENHLEGLKLDKSDRLLHLVDVIEKNGGKVDTIGIQGHAGSKPTAPETLMAYYNKLAATGKKLAITEYDFASEDEQLKADYTRDLMTVVFSHPAFNCLTMWRFWDGQPQQRHSVVYANDWTMRPAGKVYEDLVFDQWWTKVDGKTNAEGKFTTRGFLGNYDIVASANGKTQTVKAVLAKGTPNVVEITLPN